MGKEKNLSIVEKFKKRLPKDFSLSKLILFGSRARGDFGQDSDFDLIVVSDSFKGVVSHKRMGTLRKYWGYDHSVDMLCLTSEEFETMNNNQTVVGLAVEEGIEI